MSTTYNLPITRQDISNLEEIMQSLITTSTESYESAMYLADEVESQTETLQDSLEEYNAVYNGFIGACKVGGFASGDLNIPENELELDSLFSGIIQTITARMTETTENFYLIYDNDENGTGYQVLFSKLCKWCASSPYYLRITIKIVIKEGCKENLLPEVSKLNVNHIIVSNEIQTTFDPTNWAAVGNYGIDEIVKLMKTLPGGLIQNGVMCCYLGGANTIYGNSPIGEYFHCRQNHPYIRIITSKTQRKKILPCGTVELQDYTSFGLTTINFDEFNLKSQFIQDIV